MRRHGRAWARPGYGRRPMATDADVLAHIWRTVQGELTFDAFEDWFVTEAMDGQSNLRLEVAGILAESAGNVPDEVAIRQLAALASPPLRIAATASTGTVTVVGYAESSPGSTNVTEPVGPYSVPA